MDPAPVCGRPLLQRDAQALIGLLAVVENEAMNDQLDVGLRNHLSRRLASVGLMTDAADSRQLRQALNDLNHRLRYALGEYEEPPTPNA
jgi:hypothetical protein